MKINEVIDYFKIIELNSVKVNSTGFRVDFSYIKNQRMVDVKLYFSDNECYNNIHLYIVSDYPFNGRFQYQSEDNRGRSKQFYKTCRVHKNCLNSIVESILSEEYDKLMNLIEEKSGGRE